MYAVGAQFLDKAGHAVENECDKLRYRLSRDGWLDGFDCISLARVRYTRQDPAFVLARVSTFLQTFRPRAGLVKIGRQGTVLFSRAASLAARRSDPSFVWVLTTLGRLPAAKVRSALAGDQLLQRVEPLLVLLPSDNWLTTPANRADLDFLLMQARRVYRQTTGL